MLNLRDSLELAVRTIREFFQDQWFDRTRKVRTSGNVGLEAIAAGTREVRDAHEYQPARPAHIRHALRQIPVRDVANYSYIDLGSGKGRTLFVASEQPFRQIIGVEFSQPLHDQACANIRSFRRWSRMWCSNITCVHQDAMDFVFPDSPMVLYFFNPFGRDTAHCVLNNLAASLRRNPRPVVIVLLWPRWGNLVASVEGISLCAEGAYYQVFQACLEADVAAQIPRA